MASVVDIIPEPHVDESSSPSEASLDDLQFLSDLSASDFIELLEINVTKTNVSATHAICAFSVASLQAGLKASQKENAFLKDQILELENIPSSVTPPSITIIHPPTFFYSPLRLPPLLPMPTHIRPAFRYRSHFPPLLPTPSTPPLPSLQKKCQQRRTKENDPSSPPSIEHIAVVAFCSIIPLAVANSSQPPH